MSIEEPPDYTRIPLAIDRLLGMLASCHPLHESAPAVAEAVQANPKATHYTRPGTTPAGNLIDIYDRRVAYPWLPPELATAIRAFLTVLRAHPEQPVHLVSVLEEDDHAVTVFLDATATRVIGCWVNPPGNNPEYRAAQAVQKAALGGFKRTLNPDQHEIAHLCRVGASGPPELNGLFWENLDRLTDLDLAGEDGLTVLHVAVQHRPDLVDALIARGASVNARAKDGTTPLQIAARAGNGAVVMALLAAGADS